MSRLANPAIGSSRAVSNGLAVTLSLACAWSWSEASMLSADCMHRSIGASFSGGGGEMAVNSSYFLLLLLY